MGLNLETLIGILVILILLILADGARRMIRERHGRLRMRIDRRFGKGHGQGDSRGFDDEDDYPTDLGKPRVRSRDGDADAGKQLNQTPDTAPPIMMDTDDTPDDSAATRSAEQQSLFEVQDDDPAPPPRPGTTEPADSSRQEREPARAEPPRPAPATRGKAEAGPSRAPAQEAPPLEVIVFHLIARRPDRFNGQDMLRLLLENGLRYGEMHIFHRHRETAGHEQLEFSVANAVEPGTFDIDTMEEEQFAGITFFMKLPGPGEPLAALDRMLTVGRRLAEGLDGELKDEQHSVLTPQTMEHLRQRVQEFERRQRVSHGA